MSRGESRPLATARAQLRQRFEAQQAALNDFIACRRKAAKLEASLAKLVNQQTAALGRLAELTDSATAAALTGCSLHSAREALTAHRASDGRSRDAAAVDCPDPPRADGGGHGAR